MDGAEVREEIAKNIHDGLGQHMAGLLLSARALETQLKRRDQPETEEAAFLVSQLQSAQSDIVKLLNWLDRGRAR